MTSTKSSEDSFTALNFGLFQSGFQCRSDVKQKPVEVTILAYHNSPYFQIDQSPFGENTGGRCQTRDVKKWRGIFIQSPQTVETVAISSLACPCYLG